MSRRCSNPSALCLDIRATRSPSPLLLPDNDTKAMLLKKLFLRSATRHRGQNSGDPHRAVPLLDVVRIEHICAPRQQEKYLAELQDTARGWSRQL
eukprot:5405841-Prymnesium_polylepis.1